MLHPPRLRFPVSSGMQMWQTELQHSHSSVKASAAGVDEASHHRVKDEGQDLRKKKRKDQWIWALWRFIPYLFLRSLTAIVCVRVCVCVTCRGRLPMRQQNPKARSSRLVRMKALMALVTFWILPSLLGPLVCLMGPQTHRCFNIICWTTLPF